jgi:hypothetical protein
VFDSQRPEVFHVDLASIVVKHDDRTNLRLQPGDQIYVGETRQARIEKCIPPWIRPLYQAIWDTHPKPEGSPSQIVDRPVNSSVPVIDSSHPSIGETVIILSNE